MVEKLIKLSIDEIADLYQGSVILMKELDSHGNEADRRLSDRIGIIMDKIEDQAREQ